MKYCHNLLNDINFEPASLQPCCNTRALKVPSFPYSGGPVNLRAYADHIARTLSEIQTAGDVCKGCPKLMDIDQDFLGVNGAKFKTVSINMHRHFCNCRCVYCDLWQHGDKGYGYDILPGLKSLREQGALADNALFAWGGGEPGILPTFDEAASWAFNCGYSQVVHTNALRFSAPVAELLAGGMGAVNISLDSCSRETYKAVKGLDGFHRVLDTVRRYAAANADMVVLKYIVFEANNEPGEIENFLQLSRKLGVRVQYSLNFVEINNNAVSEKTLLAAAYLHKRAKQLGLKCSAFCIDPVWEEKIAVAGERLEN